MRCLALGALVGFLAWTPAAGAAQGQPPPGVPRPTFRAAADLVAVSVVVHRPNGQPVTDLRREDFELKDDGQARPISDFRSDETSVDIALLVDDSGSMQVAGKLEAAHAVAGHLVAWLTPGTDRIGLFTFDTRLQEVEPLGPAPGNVLRRLEAVRPYGSTSLFDAIAETGRRLVAKAGMRRAVVALTDGGENSSRLSSTEVSNLASSIDVPVYIVVVVSPLDHMAATTAEDRAAQQMLASGRLGELARWTGGELLLASGPAQTSIVARQIVSELRHQYLIAFEADTRPGWHPIEVRTRRADLIVKARSGYAVRFQPSLVK